MKYSIRVKGLLLLLTTVFFLASVFTKAEAKEEIDKSLFMKKASVFQYP